MLNNILVILFFSGLAVCKESSTLNKVNNEVDKFAEKKPEVKDDWIAIDKVQHFSYSLLISLGCQYVLVNKLKNTEKSSLPISSAFSFFSFKDMVANLFGIMVGAIIINQ